MGTEEQQALITQPTEPIPGSKPWSKGLGKLLTEGDDSAGACRLVALNATLRAECTRLVPVLEEAMAQTEEAPLLAVLIAKMTTYGVTAAATSQWGVTWDSYMEALEGVPLCAVEDGFARWNSGEHPDQTLAMAGFPPRPAQLAMLAKEAHIQYRMALYRGRKALAHVEKTGVEWTPERKAAERQKMIDLGYLNEDGTPNMVLKARGMPEPERPRQSPHELAEALRRSDAQARQGGAPISRSHIAEPVADPGEVL